MLNDYDYFVKTAQQNADKEAMLMLKLNLDILYTCLRGPRPSAALLSCIIPDIPDNLTQYIFGGVLPPNGSPSCQECGECMMVDGHCVRNIHAEVNAIIIAGKMGLSCLGGTIYSWNKPCYGCTCAIIQAGIKRIVYRFTVYDEERTQQAIWRAGIVCEQFTGEL